MQVDTDIRRVTFETSDMDDLAAHLDWWKGSISFEFDEDFEVVRTIPDLPIGNIYNILMPVALQELKSKLGVHCIAIAGFDPEETPVYCVPFDNLLGAVEQLRILYDLTDGETRILIEDLFIPLEITKHGMGYAAIEECACDDGDDHVT